MLSAISALVIAHHCQGGWMPVTGIFIADDRNLMFHMPYDVYFKEIYHVATNETIYHKYAHT